MSSDRGELEPREGDDRAFRGRERPGSSPERHPLAVRQVWTPT